MNSILKGIIGLTILTIFISSTIIPFKASAEPLQSNQSVNYQDETAKNIADTFGVSKDSILTYEKQGINFKEIYKAAFLAKASNKSLQDVMSLKTEDNTWKDVAVALDLTTENIISVRQDLESTKLENKLNISKKTSLALIKQGYRAIDIAIANELSQNVSKSMEDVFIFKSNTNTWYDVAKILEISDSTFTQDIKKLEKVFHNINSGYPWEDFGDF